jgi:hypothetical protein
VDDYNKFIYLDLFWQEYHHSFPELYKVFLLGRIIPVSNAEVERSFNFYRCVLTEKRENLKEEHLKYFTTIYFNK